MGINFHSLNFFIKHVLIVYIHILQTTRLPTYIPTLFKTKRCGNLSGSLHIYVVATYFTTFCNNTCIMLRQPTLSQGRSVTLSANNLVIYNVVATFFLGVYRLPQHCHNIFQNVVATILQQKCICIYYVCMYVFICLCIRFGINFSSVQFSSVQLCHIVGFW